MSKYKRLIPDLELKPCPFCGSEDIRYSMKTTTISFERAYHFTMYCWSCNCYGPRVLHKCGRHIYNRSELEKSVDFYTQAADAWNRRAPEKKEPMKEEFLSDTIAMEGDDQFDYVEYKPVCKFKNIDCIYDPAYIKATYPGWYKELYGELTPEEAAKSESSTCARCSDNCYLYDDEDK